ncbi:hypothetical protein DPMN_081089 [Dreissena polymorpha]|uniref:Uncharacterized protein n=1 Tax=Dreissena polymorpha TaxID=45954 RepID=A0A9D3Y5E6_DREPO|nr:hypothetical protein DPMN_081089 [Dreissena polymorpha]
MLIKVHIFFQGRVPNANTGNSDTWARYTQFTDGNRIVGNQLLGNQQFDVKSGVSVGLTQNGFDSMDGSLTKNGFQAGHSQFNSGFPVLAGTSGINGAQTGNSPTRIAGNNNNSNNNLPFQWLRKK